MAKRLKVTREFLSRARNRDKRPMPCLKLGTGPNAGVRYDWSDVVAWMRDNANPPPPSRPRGRPRNIDRRRDDEGPAR